MAVLFETEHLIFRKFDLSDADQLYNNHLEKEMMKWIPNESYADMEEAKQAILFYQDCVERKVLPYVLAIVSKDSGELIGDTGVNEVEGRSGEVEIGYSICNKYSGRGLATEALNAMTEYIVRVFDSKVLYGRIVKGNEASVKVMKKAGYSYWGEELEAEDDPYGNGMIVYRKEIDLQ